MPRTAPPPLDFDIIERLREHMLLSASDMAKIFGVSRVVYYKWIGGAAPRGKNAANVRSRLAEIEPYLRVGYPSDEVKALSAEQRMQRLLGILQPLE